MTESSASAVSEVPEHLWEPLSAFVEGVKRVFEDELRSIVLYGSAARDEHVPAKSDVSLDKRGKCLSLAGERRTSVFALRQALSYNAQNQNMEGFPMWRVHSIALVCAAVITLVLMAGRAPAADGADLVAVPMLEVLAPDAVGAYIPLEATEQLTRSIAPPAEGQALVIRGRMGKVGAPLAVGLSGAEGKGARLSLVANDEATIAVGASLPDGRTWGTTWYVRPSLYFYVGKERKGSFFYQDIPSPVFEEREQVWAKYHLMESSLDHAFTIRLENGSEGMLMWLDGRFLGAVPGAMTEGSIALSAGNVILEARLSQTPATPWFQPVEIAPYARPGNLLVAQFPYDPGARRFNNVPFLLGPPNENIDVGVSRWLEEDLDPADFCDNYTTRSAFDGDPESIILRVPKAQYVAAHLLCAAENDAQKVPVLSLRVTRFDNHLGDSGGRGDAFADSTVYLPREGEEPGPGVTRVGEITAKVQRWGGWNLVTQEQKLPLYLVTVPLKMGEIPDLLGEDAPSFGRPKDFFDIELTKELRAAIHFFALQNSSIKPLGLPSSVHVFGLTLEKSPIAIAVTAKEPGNIFYAADKPVFDVRLANTKPEETKARLAWETTDFYGNSTSDETAVELPGAGTKDLQIPLSQPRLGWFKMVIRLSDSNGRLLWEQPTTYALLPPDTRKAGPESPFGVWWFARTHGCCERLDWMGPILLRMGMRHVCPGPFTEEEMAPYKLTYSMVPDVVRGGEGSRDEFLKKNPSIRLGMVFHEYGIPDTDFPYAELLGNPAPQLTEAGKKAFDNMWDKAVGYCTWYRENRPDIKVTFGNSSSGISVQFMRHGFPKDLIDMFGMEGVAGWKMPERQPELGGFQEVWCLREIQKIYGYDDIPASSGYEYIGRNTNPARLSEAEQADYYVRDALHALAYGYPSINIGLTDDTADSYSYTIYALTGFVHRNPLLNPKPSYVTYATMTRMLDGAKFQRYLNTGSLSLYALEFARDEERIYALWTLRGKRKVTLHFEGEGKILATDCMGNSADIVLQQNQAAVDVTTSPMYLTTLAKVASIVPGESLFAEMPPKDPFVISNLWEPSEWEIEKQKDTYLETYAFDDLNRLGKFTVSAVNDPERGPAMELTLQPQPEIPKICPRYVALRMKKPLTIPGEVGRLGVWVKGNSSWGRIVWEFTDAKGERFISVANEASNWNVSDWKSETYINFDGWNFLSLDLPKRYPGGHHGPRDRNWHFEGGDGVVQFPITFTRLIVILRDSVVYVKDMTPVPNPSIRIKDLMAGD